MRRPATEPAPGDDFEAAVDDTIATCDGDVRAAVRALLVALNHCQTELDRKDHEIAQLLRDISHGYSRGRHWQQTD